MKNRFLLSMAVAIKIVLLRFFYLFKLVALPVVVVVGCIIITAEWAIQWMFKALFTRGLIHDWPDALKGLLGYGRLPRKEKSRY